VRGGDLRVSIGAELGGETMKRDVMEIFQMFTGRRMVTLLVGLYLVLTGWVAVDLWRDGAWWLRAIGEACVWVALSYGLAVVVLLCVIWAANEDEDTKHDTSA
jgi:phosphotransferase system  glucose/maltose/N-acetylglucosamine-specific IIC component